MVPPVTINPLLLCVVLVFITKLALSADQKTYFPVVPDGQKGGLSAFEGKWFSEILASMKEPIIYKASADSPTTFRLLIVPSLGIPMSIRATKHASIYTLISKGLGTQIDYRTGSAMISNTVKLSDENSNKLDDLLNRLNLFSVPAQEDASTIGTDGYHSVFEGLIGKEYHVIARWCPDIRTDSRELQSFVEVCAFLHQHSGFSDQPSNRGQPIFQSTK